MAGFSFAPTYQDYLNTYNSQHGQASEGGGGGQLSQAQWDALGAQGQWTQIGNGFALAADDPRYAAIAQQLGIKPGTSGPDATIVIGSGKAPLDAARQNGHTSFVNPGAVLQGDGSWATAHSNLTPQAEFAGGGLSDKGWGIAALSTLLGGAALGTALGGSGAVAGAGVEGGGFSGFGDIAAPGNVGGSIVGNAGMPGYAGAGDEGGFGGSLVNPEPPPPGEAFSPPPGQDPAYPGTGNPNYTGPEPEYDPGPGATPNIDDPAYPGTGNPNYTGPEPGMGPASVTDLSVQQPWYQPYLDRFVAPGAAGRFLAALPGVASALKPLASGPPGGGTTAGQATSMAGKTNPSLEPKAHPFQAAQNEALNFKASQTPVKSLGDYLRGT